MTLNIRSMDLWSRSAGFTLVELLVALTVCTLLSGAVAAVVPSARAAFESTPEVIDQQQRERTVVDVLARVLRSAALVHAVRDDGTSGVVVRAVTLLEPDPDGERFHALRVLSIAGPGRGVLATDQPGASGALQLRPDTTCPSADDVCGFSIGDLAAVVDVEGRFNVFSIAAADSATQSLRAAVGFAAPYPAGSAVFAVSSDTYRLEAEGDGSQTLVRQTGAGAVQPMVDNVGEFSVRAWRPADRLARVDIALRLGARSTLRHRQVADRTLHLSVALRNPS